MNKTVDYNDEIFYKLGKILLLPGILGAVFLHIIGREGIGAFPPCVFRNATGLFCPGCGGTRAIYYFVRGEIIKSFFFHPFVPYTVIVYILFMCVMYYRKHYGKKEYKAIRLERYIYVGIAILLLQCILKEILLVFFRIQWM